MSQKRRQIVASVLVAVFALYYANVSFFYHSHTINGAKFSHSHFHNTAHTQTGTHSASEISLISALSAFQSLQAALCFIGVGLFLLSITILQRYSDRKQLSATPCYSYLRGPPALV